jgi:hypothetical protein
MPFCLNKLKVITIWVVSQFQFPPASSLLIVLGFATLHPNAGALVPYLVHSPYCLETGFPFPVENVFVFNKRLKMDNRLAFLQMLSISPWLN